MWVFMGKSGHMLRKGQKRNGRWVKELAAARNKERKLIKLDIAENQSFQSAIRTKVALNTLQYYAPS